MSVLTFGTHGETSLRLTQVIRDGERDNLADISVEVRFERDRANSSIETDRVKNSVYVLAGQKPITSIENFASELARYYLGILPEIREVTVEILVTPWIHIGPHGAAFIQAGTERRSTKLTATHFDDTFVSGIRGLEILKISPSDRLLGTVLHGDWTYRPGRVDFNVSHKGIRQILLDAFARCESVSPQETLAAMAREAIEAFPIIEEIHLLMPNKGRQLIDLSQFQVNNPYQIFVPPDEPSGYVEARISAKRN
ncbi:MAG: hypothetical protein JO217_09985 [Acidobacteriaceae bacterium]|nr:hypothetical protein [Acidobacteriaceae bacterium]